MQSHIGCTCKICLQSAFLNVSSNCLPEQMQSHIGRICDFSPQSGLISVSSNQLPSEMHSHIGCICSVFLEVEFSNVPVNSVPQQRLSYIVSGSLRSPFLSVTMKQLRVCSALWDDNKLTASVLVSWHYQILISNTFTFPNTIYHHRALKILMNMVGGCFIEGHYDDYDGRLHPPIIIKKLIEIFLW